MVPAWHLIGPFDAAGGDLDTAFPPQHEFDLAATYPGKGTTAVWKTQAATMGAVGLVETYGSPHFADWCTAYAVCTVTSPVEQQVQLRFGSDDEAVIWFDEAGRHLESLEAERPVGEQMLMQFHRAVTSLVRKAGDLEDAYRALQVVLAARASERSGRREPLPPCP